MQEQSPEAPEQAFSDAVLRNLMLAHEAPIAATCRLTELVTGASDSPDVRIPMRLAIAADGQITSTRIAGKLVLTGPDGTTHEADAPAGLAECYGDQLKNLVRFPAATAGAEVPLQVPAKTQLGTGSRR